MSAGTSFCSPRRATLFTSPALQPTMRISTPRLLRTGPLGDPVVDERDLGLAQERRAVERHPRPERRPLGDLLPEDAAAGIAGEDDVAAGGGPAGPERRVAGEVQPRHREPEAARLVA